MKVETRKKTFRGRAIDLREESVAAADVVAAIRSDDESNALDIECADPHPVHEYVGYIESGTSVRVRAAVAAAARSLGMNAPQDEEIANLEASLRSLDVEEVSVRSERRRVAEMGGTETELREKVAALRGRVQAIRESGGNGEDVESKLRSATRELAETETERIAAEQALEATRKRQRSARNERERRLRLRDRKANLERTARGHLVRQVHERFVAAVEAVPGRGRVPKPGTFEGDSTTAALAIARLARVRAPVVLACERFETPETAADCLNAPVLQV